MAYQGHNVYTAFMINVLNSLSCEDHRSLQALGMAGPVSLSNRYGNVQNVISDYDLVPWLLSPLRTLHYVRHHKNMDVVSHAPGAWPLLDHSWFGPTYLEEHNKFKNKLDDMYGLSKGD